MTKYKKPRQAKTTVSEPAIRYNNQELKIFSSFEEMNEADLIEMASFTPLQRMAHVTALLKQFYGDELKKKFSNLTIRFK